MQDRSPYWFPAKRYGWGWGLPATWQGWCVLAIFVAAVAVVSTYINPDRNPALFAACIVFLIAFLTIVMWLKGEPQSWHWGDR